MEYRLTQILPAFPDMEATFAPSVMMSWEATVREAGGVEHLRWTSSLAYRWIQKEPRKEGAIWTIYQRETAADPWTVERRYVIRGARAVRHETPPVPPAVRRISDVPTAPPGFLGKRGRELGEAQDGLHVVRLAEYAFPDGSVVPYAELHETHDGQYPGRVMALSVLVHLAQNVGASEVWEINNREGPPEETDTPALRFSALVAEALTRPGAPTQRALAVAVGLDEGNLSAWLAGRRTIPVRAIEAMFARLGILPR